MLFRAFYVDYTTKDGELLVRLAGRTEDGDHKTLHVTGIQPYIFVPKREPTPKTPEIKGGARGFESFDGKELKKLYLDHPQSTKEVKSCFTEAYESDIPFYRRCALDGWIGYLDIPEGRSTVPARKVDTDPEVDEPIEPRVCIGDIEVLPEAGVGINEMKEQASQPVICATFWDSQTGDYDIFALESDDQVSTAKIKHILDDHWDGREEYVGADFNLHQYGASSDLAAGLVNYFRDRRFDLVSGWNFVDFDWEYLLRWLRGDSTGPYHLSPWQDVGSIDYAAKSWTMERVVSGLPAFDMMDAFCEKMTWTNWRSKALDYVASEELGVGKVDDVDIADDYHNERSRLIAYNIIDTQLCVELEREKEIFDFFLQLADQSSVPIYDTFSELRLVDGYILSRRADDEVLPEAHDKDLAENAGALVFEQEQGIEPWVGVHDVKSLYPSAIITCNISPETMTEDPLDGDVVIPDMPAHADDAGGTITREDIDFQNPMVGFSLDQQGIIPKYIAKLFSQRDRFKELRDQHDKDSVEYENYDTRQYAIKVIQNSFYGVASSDYWRLAVDGLGDATTGAGRFVLWSGADTMENDGFEIITGDTDSVIVSLGDRHMDKDLALQRGESIELALNSRMDSVAADLGITEHPHLSGDLHGTDRHCFVWEFEKLYKRFMASGSKKRYAGHIVWKEGKDRDDIDIVGLETRRSDVPEIAAEIQQDVIEMVLKGEGFEDVSSRLESERDRLRDSFDARTHALPAAINQPIDDYPNRPVKRGVKYSNEHLDYDWVEGDSPWLVYVDPPGDQPPTDVIAIDWMDDLPGEFEVDVGRMEESCFQQPLAPILDVMDWTWRELKAGRQAGSFEGDEVDGNPLAGSLSNDLEDW